MLLLFRIFPRPAMPFTIMIISCLSHIMLDLHRSMSCAFKIHSYISPILDVLEQTSPQFVLMSRLSSIRRPVNLTWRFSHGLGALGF